MRDSSNPVMRGVVRDNQNPGGYAGFGSNAAGAGQAAMYNQYGQQVPPQYAPPQAVGRQLTIDDVVTKTAITLGVLTVTAILSYVISSYNNALAGPLMGIGAIVGLVLVLVASFGRKQDNPAIVLAYAAFEGLFVGSISFVFANWMVSGDTSAGALIGQAVLGTFGVFFGMLLVYKIGAIRVTPRFTRMLFAVQVIGSANELGIDHDKLNVSGGAIALGHPFGMTGARITTTLLNNLQTYDKTFGIETMCVGGGQGMAMVLERLS